MGRVGHGVADGVVRHLDALRPNNDVVRHVPVGLARKFFGRPPPGCRTVRSGRAGNRVHPNGLGLRQLIGRPGEQRAGGTVPNRPTLSTRNTPRHSSPLRQGGIAIPPYPPFLDQNICRTYRRGDPPPSSWHAAPIRDKLMFPRRFILGYFSLNYPQYLLKIIRGAATISP